MNWKALLITIGLFIGVAAVVYGFCVNPITTFIIILGITAVLGVATLMLITYCEIAERLKK